MVDGQDLVRAVVGALVRTAANSATSTGGAAVDVVRARLRGTPDGAQAVDAVEAAPSDRHAQARLAAAVGQLLATDQAFARYLVTTELGHPAHQPTPPKPGAATTLTLRAVGGIPGGGLATAGRRAGGSVLVALVLIVVAALVALGIHLGSRPVLRPGVPGLAHGAVALRDPGQMRGVLPDLQAMPAGWTLESGPSAGTGSGGEVRCLLPDACDQQLGYASVTFRGASPYTVNFTVVSFASTETARRAFDLTSQRADGAATAVPLPRIGDQSTARTTGGHEVEALVRVGTTLLYTRATAPDEPTSHDATVLTAFAHLLAERAQQAQDGLTPDAVDQG
ncbi:hypothetical protein [Kitasatospora sp. NPDC088351]|uniref:hypothetical protein n=1 Tax=unclassified Kitasatospora TaxID=2633591 RepID=UPI003446C68E